MKTGAQGKKCTLSNRIVHMSVMVIKANKFINMVYLMFDGVVPIDGTTMIKNTTHLQEYEY